MVALGTYIGTWTFRAGLFIYGQSQAFQRCSLNLEVQVPKHKAFTVPKTDNYNFGLHKT